MFLESKNRSPFGVRFSIHNYSIDNKLHSYPLYAVAGFLSQYHQHLRDKLFSLLNDASC